MKKAGLLCMAALVAGPALAQTPDFKASCPDNIQASSSGGKVVINGHKASIKRYSDTAFDASIKGVVLSVMAEPGQDISAMYTGKHGANGVCQVTQGAAPASAGATDTIAVKDMPRYCAGEASAKFAQRPVNISTQPAIKEQGMYSVFGQFPPSGASPTVFICTFDGDGKLVGVDKQ